jgi:hypothetical protein
VAAPVAVVPMLRPDRSGRPAPGAGPCRPSAPTAASRPGSAGGPSAPVRLHRHQREQQRALADADTSGTASTINFAAGPGQIFATAQTITPSATLALTNTTAGASITIAGPTAGLTVSGNHQITVFEITPGVSAVLTGLTVANGTASILDPQASNSHDGGGIYNEGASSAASPCWTPRPGPSPPACPPPASRPCSTCRPPASSISTASAASPSWTTPTRPSPPV